MTKIVYADDDEMQRKLWEMSHKMYLPDCESKFFSSGKDLDEYLAGLTEDYPSCVIADNEMHSGLDGHEIIRKYAKQPNFSGTSFILVYGGHKQIGEQALVDGAKKYFTKPTLPSQVLGYVRENILNK